MMDFRTIVDIPSPDFEIEPCTRVLCVGSCFADNIGKKFEEEKFHAEINPFGVMYNPFSVLHTIQRTTIVPDIVVMTLGTNHVYIENSSGEIVDNCQKRPQYLFTEKELGIDECEGYLNEAVSILKRKNNAVKVIVTVSPIRYRKYGYHESQLSKATLLLASDKFVRGNRGTVTYFPAYEIVNDELRDYRFYQQDMLHPSAQAVEYIWEKLVEKFFSPRAKQFLKDWEPIKRALAHKPFNSESEEYKTFMDKTMLKVALLSEKYPNFAL